MDSGHAAVPSSQKRPATASPSARSPRRDHDDGDGDIHTDDGRKESCEAKASNKKRKGPAPPRKRGVDPRVLETRRTIQACCARDDLVRAMELFRLSLATSTDREAPASDEMGQRAGNEGDGDGKLLEPQTLYNLLNLCCGFSDRGLHVGTPARAAAADSGAREEVHAQAGGDSSAHVDVETRQRHADAVMSHMRERGIPMTESCYTAMVKLFCRTSVERAEALLDRAERTQQAGRPRLRMYSPLLVRYCELGQAASACQVWRRLARHSLELSEKEYTALMQCSRRAGSSALMERALSELAEEVSVPCREARLAVVEWFQSPLATAAAAMGDDNALSEILRQLPRPYPFALEGMGPVVNPGASSWMVSEDCPIDSRGVLRSGCLAGFQLRPVTTPPEIWEELMNMNETIVTAGRVDGDQSDYQGGRKGPKKALDEAAMENRRRDWESFGRYLERPATGAIDAIVDGANVGYFETNYAGAPKHVDYQQIDWIVQHFLRRKQSVVVFLNARHVSSPLMPPHAEPIVRSWRDAGALYVTPRGMNDDWFWLHAALVRRSLVVTNDEMRDHHFQMLAQRGFLRWKDRHQVRFRFGEWIGACRDDSGDRVPSNAPHEQQRQRSVELVFPSGYSRRIQRVEDGLVIPMPKRGDEKRFLDGSHQADDSAPVEESYVCLRPSVI